jgi:hypothetical protein
VSKIAAVEDSADMSKKIIIQIPKQLK